MRYNENNLDRSHRTRPPFATLLASLALLCPLGPAACADRTDSGAAPPPPEVTAITVQPRDLPAVFEYVGQIAGIREVEVRPRVSGILERWNYTEGSA
ncbi:MAG: hypothetical protein AB1515_00775, partial [Nitrospirota bacterium]